MRSVECEGESIDEAIAKALGTLQVERDRVEIECMVNRLIGRDGESGGGRMIVDVESYRDRRREALEQMAKRLAEKVKATGKVVSLSPMSPRDRRIVHLALQEDPAVTTRSHGDGQYRKVLLIPATGGGHRPAR